MKFSSLFTGIRPVIAMVHLNPMPGTPLYDADAGVEGIHDAALKDLEALQAADVDAVMFGNENELLSNLVPHRSSCSGLIWV